MKHLILLTIILSSILLFASCQKTCRCYQYNGSVRDYSQQDVKNHGGSCSDMKYQANYQFYSLCEWDN